MLSDRKIKKENKELIIRDIKEKFSELFNFEFNEMEFGKNFMNKFEEVFKESFYIGKEFDVWKEYNEEEEKCLEEEGEFLCEEFYNFKKYYQEVMDCAETSANVCNKFNKRIAFTLDPFITCTFLEDEGIYQYTVNESTIVQKSFEHYIGQIYEHYNLMKNYLETHQL